MICRVAYCSFHAKNNLYTKKLYFGYFLENDHFSVRAYNKKTPENYQIFKKYIHVVYNYDS